MPRTRRCALGGLVVTTATVANNVVLLAGAPPASAAENPPIPVAGNFIDDGFDRDEIVHYQPGTGADYLFWDLTRVGGTASWNLTQLPVRNATTYEPFAGDFNGDGYDDIFWYRPGTGTDSIWTWVDGDINQLVEIAVNVNGTYTPIVGDYNGDGSDDIFWYQAGGTDDDRLWRYQPGTDFSYTTSVQHVSGDYKIVAGHFTGADNDNDDLILWRTDGNYTRLWEHDNGQFGGTRITLTNPAGGNFEPFTLDSRNDGYDDVFWYRKDGTNRYWDHTATGTNELSGAAFQLNGTYKTATGDFFGDGHDDIYWLGTEGTHLWDWHRDSEDTLKVDKMTFQSAGATAAIAETAETLDTTATSRSRTSAATSRVVLEATSTESLTDNDAGVPTQ